MRRALLNQLPALTKFYGITPPDVDAMSLREVSEYLTQMDIATREAAGRG